MACKYYGNCEHQSGWCQSDSMLIKCTYGLNNLCSERIQKIVKLEEENKELKRLLRLGTGELTMAKCENCYHARACLNSLFENKVLNNTDDFGKTVFLTREEAERALEEREKNG